MAFIDVTKKDNIIPGLMVDIVAEKDKATQDITRGYVKEILSKSDQAKGIKVKLTSGVVGRVKYVPSKHEIKAENFKFYNQFFFKEKIYSIWSKKENRFMVVNKINSINRKAENVVLLFTEKNIAHDIIKGTSLDTPDLIIREINRKKPVVDNFKTLNVTSFSIDGTRKLSFEKMIEWEAYFKSMR